MHVVQPYPDEVEAQRLQVRHQPRPLEIPGHDLRSRREAGLHPGAGLEPPLHRLLRQETRADHHGGVGGVRAAGDRRDDHRPVVQVVHALVQAERPHARRPRSRADGVRVPGGPPAFPEPPVGPFLAVGRARLLSPRRRGRRGRPPWTRKAARGPGGAWGPPGRAPPRTGRGKGCRRRRGPRVSPVRKRPWVLAVRLHQPHLRLVAPGEEEVFERFVVHGEDSRSWRRTPGTCSRSSRGRPRTAKRALSRRTRRTCPPRLCSRSICVIVRTRSVAVAPAGSFPREPEPHDLGNEHGDRLPEHRRLRLDPSDAPADDSQPVDHRRVGVGPDEGVGERLRSPADLPREHHGRQVLQVHLVADPRARGNDAEVPERLPFPSGGTRTAPRCARIPCATFSGKECDGGEPVHLDGVVDDQVRPASAG